MFKSLLNRIIGGAHFHGRESGGQDEYAVRLRKCGAMNNQNVIYVIRQPSAGRGLWSLTASIICHLHLAEQFGFTPIVDMKSWKTVYNDSEFEKARKIDNAWEYYFEPVSSLKISEAYSSRRVLLSGTSFPENYPYSISCRQDLREIAQKYIRPRKEIREEIEEAFGSLLANHRVLGVHYRGQEQKTAPGHWYPPSERQMRHAIDNAIAAIGFDRIFLVSEDADYIRRLRAIYGSMIVYLPHYRTSEPINAYHENPRPMHRYLLGKECLVDAMLLARCQGLVGCTSNIPEAAKAFKIGKYETYIKIDNGPNVNNRIIARYMWRIKSRLPERLGGFSLKAVRTLQY